jgi:2-phosphoglycerate kinase
MDKYIILIGGTVGTGKTTLASLLCSNLNLDHKLGTGFMREILRTQYDPMKAPYLFDFTFRSDRPIETLVLQAQALYLPVKRCIERARREGTSLVIEGSHLLPSLYANEDNDLFIILEPPSDRNEHIKRIRGDTHRNRKISESDIDHIIETNRYLLEEKAKANVTSIVFDDNLDEIISWLKQER